VSAGLPDLVVPDAAIADQVGETIRIMRRRLEQSPADPAQQRRWNVSPRLLSACGRVCLRATTELEATEP
jgi:hypothetical protein